MRDLSSLFFVGLIVVLLAGTAGCADNSDPVGIFRAENVKPAEGMNHRNSMTPSVGVLGTVFYITNTIGSGAENITLSVNNEGRIENVTPAKRKDLARLIGKTCRYNDKYSGWVWMASDCANVTRQYRKGESAMLESNTLLIKIGERGDHVKVLYLADSDRTGTQCPSWAQFWIDRQLYESLPVTKDETVPVHVDTAAPAKTIETRIDRFLAVYDSLLESRDAVYGRDGLAVQTGVYNQAGYALLGAIQVLDSVATGGGFPDFVYLADLARGSWAGRFHEYEKFRAMEQPNHDGRNSELLNEMHTMYVRVLELGYGNYRRSH
jgi:hypothetical protein